MSFPRHSQQLVDFLVAHHDLDTARAERVVEEIHHYFNQTPEEFIRNRHRELQLAGLANPAIFLQIQEELAQRLFAAAPFSERKIRRAVYG